MKKVISIFILILALQVYGQAINRKWIEVIQLPDQKVYVDTSTIRQLENQISVLSISFFNPPKMINAIGAEAASVKSQILFNLASQTFTTVGTLYYDSKLKILGESSVPGHSLSGESFATQIDSNQSMIAVYAYCLNYINRGERVIENKDFSRSGSKIKSFIDNKVKPDSSPTSEDTREKKSELTIKQPKTDVNSLKPEITKLVKKDSTIKIIEQSSNKKDNALSSLAAKKNSENYGGVETTPRSGIFKDGAKYSFQVSSWKNKGKAESETARLKGEGHNAFIVEAYITERGGTWYRVRIGYFDSLEETESYMKKLK